MSTQDEDVAGQYVMGLLEGMELADAERRMVTDPVFASAVDAWRYRLVELDGTADEIEPRSDLWARIASSVAVNPAVASPRKRAPKGVAGLWTNLRFWRGAGIGGMAAALACALILAVSLGTSRQLRNELTALAQRNPVYVAVLVDDASREVGAIVNAFSNGRVELIPLRNIDVPVGRTLQVWTLWDRSVGPKSIGLTSQSRALQLDLKSLPETVADQLFEITLEPEGGSPTGRPTGPILFKGNTSRAL